MNCLQSFVCFSLSFFIKIVQSMTIRIDLPQFDLLVTLPQELIMLVLTFKGSYSLQPLGVWGKEKKNHLRIGFFDLLVPFGNVICPLFQVVNLKWSLGARPTYQKKKKKCPVIVSKVQHQSKCYIESLYLGMKPSSVFSQTAFCWLRVNSQGFVLWRIKISFEETVG